MEGLSGDDAGGWSRARREGEAARGELGRRKGEARDGELKESCEGRSGGVAWRLSVTEGADRAGRRTIVVVVSIADGLRADEGRDV